MVRRPARAAFFWGALAVLAAGFVVLGVTSDTAFAQSGWWPWSTQQEPARRPPPVPREPTWRNPPPGDYPPPQRQPQPQPQPWQQQAAPGTNKAPICLQLEQRLVTESQRGSSTRDQLPKIEADMRQAERASRAAQAQLERLDCFDHFLFSKTLRRSRQCIDLNNQAETARRRVAELDAQRQQLLGSRDRSYMDDIYRELARNNCGNEYTREVQRRGLNNPFSSLWQDEDSGTGGRGNEFGALPFATYRTVCVRLCDGYYFPVSFSTLKNHFERDVEICQSKCAAPTELFYHQNPGGSMEQAMSVRNQTPYTNLKSAFRYRKEYVQGCSCKQAEYIPSPADRGDRKAEAPATDAPISRRVQR